MMCGPEHFDEEDQDRVEAVTMTLPLDARTRAWLAQHSADDDEAAELIASIVQMIVEDDLAAHETMH